LPLELSREDEPSHAQKPIKACATSQRFLTTQSVMHIGPPSVGVPITEGSLAA
jgi:hypothetical protein